MTNRKQKRKPEPSPKPEAPKVQHSPGGIKGRWLVNSLSFVLVILAVVVILISVGVSGYYYATVRDNLASRAATTSDTFRKYFTDTYDQFYTQAEATVTTFQDQDKFEQQFLDANGRIQQNAAVCSFWTQTAAFCCLPPDYPVAALLRPRMHRRRFPVRKPRFSPAETRFPASA